MLGEIEKLHDLAHHLSFLVFGFHCNAVLSQPVHQCRSIGFVQLYDRIKHTHTQLSSYLVYSWRALCFFFLWLFKVLCYCHGLAIRTTVNIVSNMQCQCMSDAINKECAVDRGRLLCFVTSLYLCI